MQYYPGVISAPINIAASGDNTVIALAAGKQIIIHQLLLVAAGAVSIKMKDGASTDLTPAMSLLASTPLWLDAGEPWFVTTAGNAFIINLSGAVQVSGRIYYSLYG